MPPRIAISFALVLAGCSVDRSVNVPTQPSTRVEAVSAQVPPEARPMALVDRAPLTLLDMQDRLLEAAGGEVLREFRLEEALRNRLEQEGINLDEDQLHVEEDRLLLELDEDPDVAKRLLQAVRDSEGLGPTRYQQLLWRNAALRSLVQPLVTVDSEAMQLVWQITHGPRVRIRVIVVPSYSRAAAIVEALDQGQDFTRLAVDWSIDPSRDRGGLLDPFSTADPAFPVALRQAMDDLEAGAHTNPILLGDRFLIARLEEQVPADGIEFDSIKSELHEQARLTQERILMQEEAYRLRNEPSMRIFNSRLESSFKSTDPERPGP